MSGTVQGTDGQQPAAGADGNVGVDGADGTDGANGGAGTAGQSVTNTTTADQSGTFQAIGGNGGGGGNGGNGGDAEPKVAPGTAFYYFGNGGNGGNGGAGGDGGTASMDIQASATGLGSITAVAAGGYGGSTFNQTSAGAAGSDTSQYRRSYDYDGHAYVLDYAIYAGLGGNGAAGSTAGDGAGATTTFDGQTGAVGTANILLGTFGGTGGDGSNGSDGGSGGDMTPSRAGPGGAGGSGANATTELAGWNVIAQAGAQLVLSLQSIAGNGGVGAVGGNGGVAQHTVAMSNGPNDSNLTTDTFGDGGNGGAGGSGGQAVDRFTGNTVVGAGTLSISLIAQLGTAGTGGSGGVSLPPNEPVDPNHTYVSQTPGTDGAAGAMGTEVIDVSGNTIGVTGELDLLIQSAVPITGPDVAFTFANNSFDGGGTGTLLIGPGGATASFASVIDVRDQTLSIAGSAANQMTGFATFTNDALGSLFIDGLGNQTYNVTTVSPGAPDDVVFQPGHGADIVNSGGVANLLIDLAGFGAALSSFASVQADTADDGQGNSIIATPDGGSIFLSGLSAADLIAANFSFDAAPACYCRGTMIATDEGERAIESLAIGDTLLTQSGAMRTVRWIGRRSYGGRFVAFNRSLLPVLIRAGALGHDVPTGDLWVSPQHAMYLGGVLVPARALLNGGTIVQPLHADPVDYFHLELDSHDVILANGAASETFVDDDSRSVFHNAHDYAALHPVAQCGPAQYYAPRVESGQELETIRRSLDARAAAMSCRPAMVA